MYGVGGVVRLLRQLGGVRSARRLVLLAFLADYDRVGDVVIKYLYMGEPLSRARFYIWTHAVMSSEVWRAVGGDETAESGVPPEVGVRLREVVARYGELSGGQLERLALRLLRLRPEDLADFMGMYVDDYLREVELKLKPVDLTTAPVP